MAAGSVLGSSMNWVKFLGALVETSDRRETMVGRWATATASFLVAASVAGARAGQEPLKI